MKHFDESLFLGDDWIMYVGVPGDFERSEMISPCMVLSQPSTEFRLCFDRSDPLEASCFLHASGHWSSGIGAGVIFLYFDALSWEGLAIQKIAMHNSGCLPWQTKNLCTLETFDALRHNPNMEELALACIASYRAELRATLPAQPAVDPRLRRVAALIADCPDGRLSLSPLSISAGICSDHLRQQFRRVSGMTLSRYQMWQRMRSMIRHACKDYAFATNVKADAVIHAAGFHDTSHGARVIRRYFGATPSSTKNMHFVDCCALITTAQV